VPESWMFLLALRPHETCVQEHLTEVLVAGRPVDIELLSRAVRRRPSGTLVFDFGVNFTFGL
jgi:hypothetical protein